MPIKYVLVNDELSVINRAFKKKHNISIWALIHIFQIIIIFTSRPIGFHYITQFARNFSNYHFITIKLRFKSINIQFVIQLKYKLSWCRFYLKNTFYQLFLFSIIFPKHIFRTTFQIITKFHIEILLEQTCKITSTSISTYLKSSPKSRI